MDGVVWQKRPSAMGMTNMSSVRALPEYFLITMSNQPADPVVFLIRRASMDRLCRSAYRCYGPRGKVNVVVIEKVQVVVIGGRPKVSFH